jgi:hypothetical protein
MSLSSNELKKTKNMNGEESVASSLNSVVKKQFTNMTDQYNLYASAINEMEEKIKLLKNIMLSETFLKSCQNFTLDNATPTKKSKKDNRDTTVYDKLPANEIITTNETQEPVSKKMQYFTPSQSNSLFWCFYIIYNGFSSYEYESNYFTAEQQFKIQTVEKVKKGENKAALKEHKISRSCLESGLIGNTNITAKTLYALCLCYNLNIFYVYKNTYYEMIANIEKPIHIIKYNTETNNYSICLPVDIQAKETLSEHSEYIEKSKQSFWKLDNLEKPLRPITVYSVNDLNNICSKLDIPIVCDATNKKKTKAELYSSILQKL